MKKTNSTKTLTVSWIDADAPETLAAFDNTGKRVGWERIIQRRFDLEPYETHRSSRLLQLEGYIVRGAKHPLTGKVEDFEVNRIPSSSNVMLGGKYARTWLSSGGRSEPHGLRSTISG